MNFGWGGTNDGWYRANSFNAGVSDNNYLEDQKTINIIR